MRGRLLQDGYSPLAVDPTLDYSADQQRRHNVTHTIPLTTALADTVEHDLPAEADARPDYRPEHVLAALQNWGELEELRARGRMPTLLQCLYLDIQQAVQKLAHSPAIVFESIRTGLYGNEPIDRLIAWRVCQVMNGAAYVGW